jgi:ABC-2 type transport system ATP-binding protein
MSFVPSAPLDASVLEAVHGVTSVRSREDGRMELSLDDDAVLEVLGRLSAHGVRPGHLRVVDSTLDDAFLDLTSEGEDD